GWRTGALDQDEREQQQERADIGLFAFRYFLSKQEEHADRDQPDDRRRGKMSLGLFTYLDGGLLVRSGRAFGRDGEGIAVPFNHGHAVFRRHVWLPSLGWNSKSLDRRAAFQRPCTRSTLVCLASTRHTVNTSMPTAA